MIIAYISSKKTVPFLLDGRKNRRFLCKFATHKDDHRE